MQMEARRNPEYKTAWASCQTLDSSLLSSILRQFKSQCHLTTHHAELLLHAEL